MKDKNKDINNEYRVATYTYLVLSLFMILIIMTTFVGSSYAWFTSTTELKDNTISAGVWQYDIVYHLDGGVNNPSNPMLYSSLETTYIYDATRVAYSFLGWYNNPEFTGNVMTNISQGTTGIVNLYAKWNAEGNSGLSYTLINNNTAYSVGGGTTNNLTHIVIPATYNGLPVTAITSSGFNGYTSMRSIDLPEGLTTINSQAFRGCTLLSTVTIPSTVTSIGSQAFRGAGLTSMIILRNSTVITGANHMLRDLPTSFKIYVPNNLVANYKAANQWSGFSTRIFSKDMIAGDYAISSVTGGVSIFQYIGTEQNITIPSYINYQSVEGIGIDAFSYNKTPVSIIVPNNVKSIGNNAFSNCTSLTSLTVLRTTGQGITTAGTTILASTHASLVISVPSDSVNAYKTATNWSAYSARIYSI